MIDIAAAVAGMELPLDAKVYALGEKYCLPKMKEVALGNLQHTMILTPGHVTKEPFRQATIIAYESTPDDDVDLKVAIALAITSYKHAARSTQVKILMQEIPNLSWEINVALLAITEALRERAELLDAQINMLKAKSVEQLTRSDSGLKRKR